MILLTGCSWNSYIIKKGSIKIKENEIIGSYEYFNGHKEYDVKLKDKEHEISIKNNSEKGNLIVYFDKEEMFNSNENYEITEKLEFKGRINKIRVEGDKHKGDFTITWETVE